MFLLKFFFQSFIFLGEWYITNFSSSFLSFFSLSSIFVEILILSSFDFQNDLFYLLFLNYSLSISFSFIPSIVYSKFFIYSILNLIEFVFQILKLKIWVQIYSLKQVFKFLISFRLLVVLYFQLLNFLFKLFIFK